MKNNYLNLVMLLSIFLFGILSMDGYAQCPLPNCTATNQDVEMEIEVVRDPAVCNNSGVVVVTITNTSTFKTIGIFDYIELCFDEPGESDILVTDWESDNLGVTMVTAPDIPYARFYYDNMSGTNWLSPGQSFTITVFIRGSCELMDQLANGNSSEFINNQINGYLLYTEQLPNASLPICVAAVSETFDVDYLLIALEECNDVIDANIGDPFAINLQAAVEGELCRKGFQVCLEVDPSIDITNLGVWAWTIYGNANIFNLQINGNVACFTVGGVSPFPQPYCNPYYPGQLGDIFLSFYNMVPTTCDNPLPVTVYTNTCDNDLLDNTCPTPIPHQSSSTCFVNIPLGSPEVLINSYLNSNDRLDFCNSPATIYHTITCQSGNASDNAFNLFFEANHYSYMNVSGITYNGTPLSAANFGAFNNANGNGSPVIVLSGNDIDINFENLTTNILGTEDIDGDGIFAELSTGNSIEIGIRANSDCPFEGDECISDLFATFYQGRITYSNQCNTFTESDTDQRIIDIGGNQAFFNPLPGPIVESPFTVSFCWDEASWTLPDLNDPDLDLGPLTVTFSNMIDLNPLVNFDIVALRYQGQDGEIITLEKNKNSKKGFPSFTFYQMPVNNCMDLVIEYDCPPEGGLFDVAIEIQATGTWENCPDCEIQLGCASALVLVSCPCDPMQVICDGGCEYVETSGMTIERITVGSGTNSSAAYACDDVVITLSGTINGGYNGDLYACVGNWAADFGFFNINSVAYTLSNGSAGVMAPMAPFNSNFGVDFDMYSAVVNVPSFVNVTVTISATVDQAMTDALAAGVYDLAVFGSLGEFTDQTIKKCGLLADYFQIYEVKTNWSQVGTNWDCSEEIRVPFRLRYIGGTSGDDFPGEDRPFNQMTGNLELSISNPNFTILGIEENGNFYAGTSFPMIENILDPPADKVGSPATSQDLHILVQATCDAPGSATITVEGTLEEDIAYGPCLSSSSFSKNVNFSFNNGGIVANALNTPINTYQRCVELTTEIYATGDPSEDVWIQFEYDPAIIESITPVSGPIGTVSTSGTNPVVWSMTVPGGVQITPETVHSFLVCFNDACDAQPVELPFYVGKVCVPAEIPNPPVLSTDPGSCFAASDLFNISFEESGLDMDVNQCNELSDDFCETIYYSVSINNPGGGNTSDLLFGLNLPDGFDVTELYYSYPSTTVNNCNGGTCAGGNAINGLIPDLLSGGIDLGMAGILPGNGNNILQGELPGIQSGVNAAQRRVNFCIGVNATCEAEASADDMVFYTSGRRPCGAEIIIENNQFTDVLGQWYVDVDATMTFIEYDLNCDNGTGDAVFVINWPDGMMVPPGQTFYVNALTTGNIQVGTPISIVPNGDPQTINIDFTFDPEEACIGQGAIGLLLYTYALLDCNGKKCEINEFIAGANANIEFNEGWVTVDDLEIDKDLCPDYGPEEGIISFYLENNSAQAGLPVTVTYHCDEDGDGIPDGPPFASQNINLPPPNTGVYIDYTIDEATFWAACPSGSITAQLNFSSKNCICVRGSLTAEVCCECPDYQFNYTYLGDNEYEFTVEPETYISLLYCWYDENGDLVFFNTLDNPVIIDFDDYGGFVPEDMCVRIESEFIDCDSTKSRAVLTDPPCSEKFCRPLDSCYADKDFDFTVLDIGLGTATIELTGTVYTNMNPYTISWYVDGDFVGTGSPLVVDVNSGTIEVCMYVSGVYQDMECVFKICKIIEIETDCEGLTADYNYQLTGPVEGGSIFTGSAMFSDPNAQHEWYVAYSDESCSLGTPLGMSTGPDITVYLPSCNYFIVVHRVVIGDCEACYARCYWVCDGRSSGEDDELGNFDCNLLKRYEWPFLKFDGGSPIGFGQDDGDKYLDASILVHPNPVRNEAAISWSMEGVEELVVHDFTGKRVRTVPLDGEQSQYLFSTDRLSQGIYFVRIQNAEGEFLVKRFEIMR
jgi:hypothetical protein